mmetsp:Transcript_21111/g.59016  ORF Transcript_21111/g.59016 Transcript_21111/m.59016 type:complete len:245 (-) Transcript_21111:92-826(-)
MGQGVLVPPASCGAVCTNSPPCIGQNCNDLYDNTARQVFDDIEPPTHDVDLKVFHVGLQGMQSHVRGLKDPKVCRPSQQPRDLKDLQAVVVHDSPRAPDEYVAAAYPTKAPKELPVEPEASSTKVWRTVKRNFWCPSLTRAMNEVMERGTFEEHVALGWFVAVSVFVLLLGAGLAALFWPWVEKTSPPDTLEGWLGCLGVVMVASVFIVPMCVFLSAWFCTPQVKSHVKSCCHYVRWWCGIRAK